VLAEDETIDISFTDGNAAVTGSGFTPDTELFVRILDSAQTHLIAMLTVRSDDNGEISGSINVGALDNGSYNVVVNNASGEAVSNGTMQVSTSGSGGGDGSGGSGGSGGTGGTGSGGTGSGDSGVGGSGGTNTGARSGGSSQTTQTFGNVPQTGVAGITATVIAMGTSILLTASSSTYLIYNIKSKRK